MIIITIGGGLGNQMFQYAFYTKLKYLYPQETIKLDLYHSFQKSHNGFELDRVFGLTAEECSVEEVAALSDSYPLDGKQYQLHRIICGLKRRIGLHKESDHEQKDYVGYYEDYLHLEKGKSYYFKGAFANTKYFTDIKDKILDMYSFPQFTEPDNLRLSQIIMGELTVSMHIRRGDYAKLGIEMADELFYRNAMRYIESLIGKNIHYILFTNDIPWVEAHFSDIINKTIVSWNSGENSYRDMQLMSLCKHNIIANSSFSFWGAYLNKNMDKIVIVPNLPFTGTKNLFKDDSWIVLENK